MIFVEKRKVEKLNLLLLVLMGILFSCNSNPSLIESLIPPVILIIKSDSIIMVEDIKGKKCVVNTTDKVDYRISFLRVGDTLRIERKNY